MKIIIDDREPELYEKCSIIIEEDKIQNISLHKETLPLGDVIIRSDDDIDIIVIERKTYNDLFASIKDGRYKEQSYRLLNANIVSSPHNVIYLLEGLFSQLKTNSDKKLLFSTITSLQYKKGFSVIKTSCVRESADYIIYMTKKMSDVDFFSNQKKENDYCSVVKKVKKDNITTDNIGVILLSQIPQVSSNVAKEIMKNFSSFQEFYFKLCETNGKCIDNFSIEINGKKRKINKNSIENIKKYLLHSSQEIILTD